ncbi:hypothetical protein ABW21_db0207380 [Orbilia brochopaga]|nr:hypothetical protein ABW21_db0207380 [Drechslerella brochopaga]
MQRTFDAEVFRKAFDAFQACEHCCRAGQEPGARKSIVLNKLKTWRREDMSEHFTKLVFEEGIINGVAVQDYFFAESSKHLEMTSENATLKLDILIPQLMERPSDGHILRSHLIKIRGLSKFSLSASRIDDDPFYSVGWGIWFDALKCHADTLWWLNISFHELPISQTRLANLGMTCRNLKCVQLALEPGQMLPFGLFDKTFFPKLEYFRNPEKVSGYWNSVEAEAVKDVESELRSIIDANIDEALANGVLSETLRLIAFGSPGSSGNRNRMCTGHAFSIEHGLKDSMEASEGAEIGDSDARKAGVRTRAMTRQEFQDAMKVLDRPVDAFDLKQPDILGW